MLQGASAGHGLGLRGRDSQGAANAGWCRCRVGGGVAGAGAGRGEGRQVQVRAGRPVRFLGRRRGLVQGAAWRLITMRRVQNEGGEGDPDVRKNFKKVRQAGVQEI